MKIITKIKLTIKNFTQIIMRNYLKKIKEYLFFLKKY